MGDLSVLSLSVHEPPPLAVSQFGNSRAYTPPARRGELQRTNLFVPGSPLLVGIFHQDTASHADEPWVKGTDSSRYCWQLDAVRGAGAGHSTPARAAAATLPVVLRPTSNGPGDIRRDPLSHGLAVGGSASEFCSCSALSVTAENATTRESTWGSSPDPGAGRQRRGGDGDQPIECFGVPPTR